MSDQLIWTCPQCTTQCRVPADYQRIRCGCGFRVLSNPPGLGDHVAGVLARVGVTEQRYRAAKQRVGLSGKCKCKRRQAALNNLLRADQ